MTVFCGESPARRLPLLKMQGFPIRTITLRCIRPCTALSHFVAGDAGFSEKPDALLIDGGAAHAKCAEQALAELHVSVPVFGMVKDNRHRTRALIRSDGKELGIAGNPALFGLIGKIQEETHRFAITYHRKLQSTHLRQSVLNQIPGVGEKRRVLLMKRFQSIKAIREATPEALSAVLPKPAAQAVFDFFHKQEDTK